MSSARQLRLQLLCLQSEAERAGLRLAVDQVRDTLAPLQAAVHALSGHGATGGRAVFFSVARVLLRGIRRYPLVSATALASMKLLWRRPSLALAALTAAGVAWWLMRTAPPPK